jgi:hypothetical protein
VGAVAGAVRDLLVHPVPLVVANLAWGVIAFGVWLVAFVSLPLATVLSVLLAWPAAVVATVASGVVRGADLSLLDALRWQLRRPAVPLLGALAVLAAVVGVVNLQLAFARDDVVGVAFATITGWGLLALGVVASVAWTVLGDVRHGALGARDVVRLAVAITFVRPPRIVLACAIAWCLLVVSAVLAAALLTVSVALAALLLAHVVLPVADTLEVGAR